MERCPSCDAELPAVAYFCPICGVKLSEAAPQPQDRRPADQPPQEPEEPTPHSEVAPPAEVAPPGWRVTPVSGQEMLGPAFWAGIAGGALVGVPGTSSCACLWMLGCGALAVFFFHKQFSRAALPNEAGRLGVLTGFFGFLVAFLVAFLSHALIRRNLLGLVAFLREGLQGSASRVNPEDAERIRELLNSPGGGAVLLAVLATVYLFSFLAMSTLGALLAGALWRRRQ